MEPIDAAGTIIGHKYCLMKEIGCGGNGHVYLAVDYALGKRWAVKVLPKEHEIFQQEAAMLKKLEHPMLPRIVDRLEEDDRIYLVMDYLEGISLKEIQSRGKKASCSQILKWSISLCDVLEYLHTRTPQIVYRDLKPDNLILTNGGALKLIDFGCACLYRKDRSNVQSFTGSRGFAAPEQYGGVSTPCTDIYGLGMLIADLCSGKAYRRLKKIIKRCTRKNPRKRYQSATQVKKELVKLQREHTQNPYIRKIGIVLLGIIVVLGSLQGILQQVQVRMYYDAIDELRFESAIEIFPEEESPYIKLLGCAVQKGETRTGIEKVENLRALYREETKAHQQVLGEIGKLYFAGNVLDESFTVDYEKALKYFSQVDSEKVDYAWYQRMAENLCRFEAETDWDQMKTDLKQMESAASTANIVREKIKHYETAAAVYLSCREGLSKAPQESLEKGIELLEKCLQLTNSEFPAGRDSGLLLEVSQNLAQACYLRGMEGDQNSESFLRRSGELYEESLDAMPKGTLHIRSILKIAYIKRIQQEYQKAEQWYQKGIEQYPQEVESYCAYALMKLIDESDVDSALALCQKAETLPGAEKNQNYQVLQKRLEAIL